MSRLLHQVPGWLVAGGIVTADARGSASVTHDGLGIDVACREPGGKALLWLRLRPAEGLLALEVAEGDLCLRAPHGAVRIAAGSEVVVSAPLARITSEEVALHTERLEAHVADANVWVERLRVHADQIREHARNVYREASEAFEQRAQRMRAIVSDLFQVTSGRTSMRSRDDTAIDGQRVLLG